MKRTRCLRFAAYQLSVFPTFTYKQLKTFSSSDVFLASLSDAPWH